MIAYGRVRVRVYKKIYLDTKTDQTMIKMQINFFLLILSVTSLSYTLRFVVFIHL
jgi:hypothetical protein